jgi:quercetin dioxygenase-like cupin family protein
MQDGALIMSEGKRINDGDIAVDISYRDQPLSDTPISEMTVREEWNVKNPPNEVTLVKNLRETELVAREYRNTKARFMKLTGERRLQPHLSELPPHGRSTNHRHTTEAVIYIIKGSGYSTIGYENEELQRVEWEEGDLFGIPLWAWHQHVNTSDTETARYLAVQDTFMIKALGLHQIERHPDQ